MTDLPQPFLDRAQPLKATMPISYPPTELHVAGPTMINVHEWLMIHHTVVDGKDGRKYDIFAATEFPILASKAEYITTSIGIPIGPVHIEFAGKIDRGLFSRVDQFTVNVKYPLLAPINGGSFKGNLRSPSGINMSINVPEIHGSVRLWVAWIRTWPVYYNVLWIKFNLTVFNVEYKGIFPLLLIPFWFTSNANVLLKQGIPEPVKFESYSDSEAEDDAGDGDNEGANDQN